MNDLVSVIIPVYNREELLQETLESVLDQTHKNWECIVVDDRSTDTTVKVAQEYAFKDNRIKIFQRPYNRSKGAGSCRNYALEQAKGDFIQFLDSDDLLQNNKFEEQLKILKFAPKTAVSTCKWGSFNVSSQLNIKRKWNSFGYFRPGLKLLYAFGKTDEYLPLMAYMLPKELNEKVGPWNENLSHNDDGEYFSRVLLYATEVLFCETTAVYYRAGDNERLSLLDDEEKIRSAIKSWKVIQYNLREHNKICRIYSGNGIRNIYEIIKNSHPHLVEENADLFKKNLRSLKWYHRFIG